ncbi:DUF2147 domain-containing protein [Ideonella sp. BN130291]|uniref:DUF2147 domain-containing protein n=1 Tax=Ideonella sp. BN130291 TaxID=3112940 RepID=UPI002E263698|nr:DUF2147 domain-containing protein [Ideonella sp. BN130291]
MKKTTIALLLASVAGVAFAQTASPVGLWKTIDDETGKEKSFVRITENNGALVGKIEKLLDPTKADAKCEKCTDERKDQPVAGMTIIRNVKKDGSDELWEGGDILDPNNGKVYKVRLKPEDGGKKLTVRGYIGMPMLGRSQTWVRVE